MNTDPAHIWLAVGLMAISGFGSIAGWFAMKKFEHYDRQHTDHYKHAGNADVHWTPRERDDLTKKLDDMGDDLKELLRRNGGARGKE